MIGTIAPPHFDSWSIPERGLRWRSAGGASLVASFDICTAPVFDREFSCSGAHSGNTPMSPLPLADKRRPRFRGWGIAAALRRDPPGGACSPRERLAVAAFGRRMGSGAGIRSTGRSRAVFRRIFRGTWADAASS
jgi:hypothetical protein